jgi:hypothetical protein
VLHTWGSALTHHPHVHMIVPGGGLSLDGARWVAARSSFLVHVNVLARLFQGKMLAMLMHAHDTGELQFFNTHAGLADKRTFKRFIAPLRRIKWVVYCKAPFAGPEQVLRYLSRYTHRVAISNRRLVAADSEAIAFRWKDYRPTAPTAGRRCGFTRTSSSGVSCCTCCPRASTASATTGSLPPPTGPRASRRPAHSSMSPHLTPTRKSSRTLRRIPPVCCPAHVLAVAPA